MVKFINYASIIITAIIVTIIVYHNRADLLDVWLSFKAAPLLNKLWGLFAAIVSLVLFGTLFVVMLCYVVLYTLVILLYVTMFLISMIRGLFDPTFRKNKTIPDLKYLIHSVKRFKNGKFAIPKILAGLVCIIIVSVYFYYRPFRMAKIDLYQKMWETYPGYAVGRIKLYNLKHGKNWFDVCGEFSLTYMARSRSWEDPIHWITTPPIKFIHDKYHDGYSIFIHAPNRSVYSEVAEEASLEFLYYNRDDFEKLEKKYCK